MNFKLNKIIQSNKFTKTLTQTILSVKTKKVNQCLDLMTFAINQIITTCIYMYILYMYFRAKMRIKFNISLYSVYSVSMIHFYINYKYI